MVLTDGQQSYPIKVQFFPFEVQNPKNAYLLFGYLYNTKDIKIKLNSSASRCIPHTAE